MSLHSGKVLLFIYLLFSLFGCGKKNTLKGVFQKKTPYEAYSSALKDANLDQTALGSKWIEAGSVIFQDSLVITLPFSETTYFDASEVTANGYRFIAEKGQTLNIVVDILSMEELTIFLDLFLLEEEPTHVATSDTSKAVINYEIKETGVFFLRLQPELLRGGRYQLKITSTPVLVFPVSGKSSNSISSFYGAVRDGGIRKHEGVDIFAPRGTPVLAVSDGKIGRVNLNRLGGKVVWVRDSERNLSYYYAHLDSQMVKPGQKVNIGDTLGLVGNTGNAITTSPHLHFGIYGSGYGAINPYSFLHTKNSTIEATNEGLDFVGSLARIKNPIVNFRLSPSLTSEIIAKLPENTLLQIKGNSNKWLRAESPDGIKGFVYYSMVESIDIPLQKTTTSEITPLLNHPDKKGILLTELEPGTSLEILAELNEYYYVKSETEKMGWLKKPI